jgi:hypothetical protein
MSQARLIRGAVAGVEAAAITARAVSDLAVLDRSEADRLADTLGSLSPIWAAAAAARRSQTWGIGPGRLAAQLLYAATASDARLGCVPSSPRGFG